MLMIYRKHQVEQSKTNMMITVKFVGALRRASGADTRVFSTLKYTVKELIYEIIVQLPELRQDLIAGEPEDLRANALILVNGREISVLKGLETILKDGDKVVFVPVVHGG